jgi:chaperonin GroEL
MGFDGTSGGMVDILESGIIGPAKVTIKALENAMSVAGMILTTETLIADEKEPVQVPVSQ